jgi:hypothetical protein
LRDESASVRYFTILQLGPRKHVKELRAIAAGRDRKAARYAASTLKRIADEEQ